MREYLRNYRVYLRQAATGIPRTILHPDLWHGFGEAVKEVCGTLLTFLACIAILVGYPLSVFVVALLACESDRQQAKRRRAREGHDRLFTEGNRAPIDVHQDNKQHEGGIEQ